MLVIINKPAKETTWGRGFNVEIFKFEIGNGELYMV